MVQLPYEIHPDFKTEAKDLKYKYDSDAGLDVQVFGLGYGIYQPDEIPPLIPHNFSTPLFTDCVYKTFCGVRVCVPEGHVGFFVPRSSARQKGLVVLSVWDAGYTGWVMPYIHATTSFEVLRGERLFQLVIIPKPIVKPIPFDFSLIFTDRGSLGSGSTGRV
jgi:hypothetical protein